MARAGRAVYGPLADRFAHSFQPEDPVVVFDHVGIAEALRDCVSRRFRNEEFFVRAILQRDYAARVDAVSASIVRLFSGLDDRRIALEQAFAGNLQANGRVLNTIQMYEAPALRLMQGALRLADALVVSSEAERRRVQDIVGFDPPCIKNARTSSLVPIAAQSGAADRRNVVIWAPQLAGDVAFTFVLALSELHAELELVSATPPTDRTLAAWVPHEQQAAALMRAKLVIDTDAFACDTALALAQWQLPLVCDAESGAQELLGHVRVFDRKRMASVFDAAVNALGKAPAIHVAAAEPAPLHYPSDSLCEGPLASIIIPTLDRPVLLRYALQSCRQQTYRNVETIVVVDGGPRLDSLAQEFPEVRFIHMAENNPVVSTNTAFAATHGKYVTMLNDDDLFFPNHIASLVTALERSGGSVAHGDVLTAYLRGSDDEWLVYGFESNMNEAVDRTSLLVNNKIGATSVMFRKDCFPDGDPFDASIPLYRDYELWLRLALRFDLIHVENITSCYTTRNQGSGQQSIMWLDQAAQAYKTIYGRYPVVNRPLIEQRRAQTIQAVEHGVAGPVTAPAGQVTPVVWPLF